MKQDFIEDNLIILSKQTIDAFLADDHPDDLIALYVFYYYTAKWQRTNQIKATRSYVIKALNWGKDRFTRTNNKLVELGLIEPFTRRDATGKVSGHYVRIKYLWKQESLANVSEKPEALKPDNGVNDKKSTVPKNHPVDSSTGGKQPTNALSVSSLNACSANNNNSVDVGFINSIPQKIKNRFSGEASLIGYAANCGCDLDRMEALLEYAENQKANNPVGLAIKLAADKFELPPSKRTTRPCQVCGKEVRRTAIEGRWVCSYQCYELTG